MKPHAIIPLCLLLIVPFAMSGQAVEGETSLPETEDLTAPGKAERPNLSNAGAFDLSLGTGYSRFQGFGSGWMLYAVPSYSVPVGNRWSLHAGVMASTFTGWFSRNQEMPGTFTSLAVFTAASYRMSDRLMLHGTGVKQLLPESVSPLSPYASDRLSLGATYRLGENVTIGATIHMQNRYTPYRDPFYGNGIYTPFYW